MINFNPKWLRFNNRLKNGVIKLNNIYKMLGTIAEFSAIAAGGLWLGRYVLSFMKKRKMNFSKYVQSLFKFLKKYHTLIGWIAFFATTSHGIYFFLQTSDYMNRIYSGVVAFIILVVLVIFGLVLQKWGKGKKYSFYKKFHQGIAIVFAITLFVHLIL